MRRARFLAAARQEFLAEVVYYNQEQPGMGARFATAFEVEKNGDLRIEVDKVSLMMPAELPAQRQIAS